MTNSSERMGILIDTTKCMGCRGCQVACKQWQGLKAEKTTFFGGAGYQNPPDLSADTFTLITFTETEDEDGCTGLSPSAAACTATIPPAPPCVRWAL